MDDMDDMDDAPSHDLTKEVGDEAGSDDEGGGGGGGKADTFEVRLLASSYWYILAGNRASGMPPRRTLIAVIFSKARKVPWQFGVILSRAFRRRMIHSVVSHPLGGGAVDLGK